MTIERAPLRFPRAGAVALTVLTLGAGAHLLAGGQLPALPIMAALAAVIALSAVLLAGRKMTAPALGAYLSASQFVLHQAFTMLSGTGAAISGVPAHHGGAHGLATATVAEGAVPYGHLAADAGSAMTIAHAVATLGTALFLARGEDALWALLDLLRPLRGTVEPAAFPPAARITFTPALDVRARRAVLGEVPARGPPGIFLSPFKTPIS